MIECNCCKELKNEDKFRTSYFYKGKPILNKTCKNCLSKKQKKYDSGKYYKNSISILSDHYLKSRLKKMNVPINKISIELEKQLIILKRTIKKLSNEKF